MKSKLKAVIIIGLIILFIVVGILIVINKTEKSEEIILGQLKEKSIILPFGKTIGQLTKIERTNLVRDIKAKVLENGKLKQGALSLSEANIMFDLINDEIKKGKIWINVRGNILPHLIINLK